jgi:hypothetical protein
MQQIVIIIYSVHRICVWLFVKKSHLIRWLVPIVVEQMNVAKLGHVPRPPVFGACVDSPKNCKDCAAPQGSAVSRLGNIGMDGLMSL